MNFPFVLMQKEKNHSNELEVFEVYYFWIILLPNLVPIYFHFSKHLNMSLPGRNILF